MRYNNRRREGDRSRAAHEGHHDFKGWYLNGSEYDFSKPVTKDITLTASWNGDSSWMYIPVIVILVLAFFFIFFILFKRRKDDEEEEELQQ